MDAVEGRTAGRMPTAGHLRLGQVVGQRAMAAGGKSSIPSRYETILFRGEREKNAFGRRTHRFDAVPDDLPGPGTYQKPRTLVKRTPSQSKKGSGAFASGSRIAAERPRALFLTPGPGSYGEVTAPHEAAARGGAGAAFALPVARRAVSVIPATAQILPGPGEYHTGGDVPVTHPLRPSAVFGSRTQRAGLWGLKGPPGGPGPGEYDTEGDSPTAQHKGPSSAFRSPTTKDSRVAALRDAQLGQLAKSLPQPPVSVSPDPAAGPTPPPPQQTPADIVTARRSRPPPSSMFAPTLLDRFGKPVVRYVPETTAPPGPGQYTEPAKPRLLISSSWAMSSTDRFSPPIKEPYKPPGPAFYSPSDATKTKQSFHLNAKGMWVS